jgi:hypothetical protein
MAQLPLHPGFARVSVWTDYGPVGKGASAAHYVLAENGNEYIMKGPTLSPTNPYVAANELVTARLAQALGLPLLDCCVLEMQGTLFFGSSWMDKGTFYPAITKDLLDKCANQSRVYDVVVLDAWLCNKDRHAENLTVRKRAGQATSPEMHLLLLNDHSHALVEPPITADKLQDRLDTAPANYVRLDFVAGAITASASLGAAITAVASVSDDTVREVVASVPDVFLPSASDRKSIVEFLARRRDRLRPLFEAGRASFPNLTGGPL